MDENISNEGEHNEAGEPDENSHEVNPDVVIPAEDELREIVFGPSSSEVEASRRIFREGLVPATEAIIHIAAYSSNERTRFQAAQYIVERNLGKISEKLALGDVWSDLLSEITSEKT